MHNRFTLEKLTYIAGLMYEELQIPAYLLSSDGQSHHALCPDINSLHPLYEDIGHILQQFTQHHILGKPAIRKTSFLEYFILIALEEDKQSCGLFIMGPFINVEIPEQLVIAMARDHQLRHKQLDELVSYYQSTPIVSRGRIYNAALMLYMMIYGEMLDLADVVYDNVAIKPVVSRENSDKFHLLSKRRDHLNFHKNPAVEKHFLAYIREGRKEALLQFEISFPTERLGILSKLSLLRNEKNLAICFITLVTRAAIDGGVMPDIAYSLSDWYIQLVEECRKPEEVNQTIRRCSVDFVEHVQVSKHENYSQPVNRCSNYIFKHLHESITLKQLAETVQLHPDYLSQLFKKEIGVTPMAYIQQERIKEAQKLLTFTDTTISDIGTLLQFHDQSYFTKVFKKWTGMTPKQYRNTADNPREMEEEARQL